MICPLLRNFVRSWWLATGLCGMAVAAPVPGQPQLDLPPLTPVVTAVVEVSVEPGSLSLGLDESVPGASLGAVRVQDRPVPFPGDAAASPPAGSGAEPGSDEPVSAEPAPVLLPAGALAPAAPSGPPTPLAPPAPLAPIPGSSARSSREQSAATTR